MYSAPNYGARVAVVGAGISGLASAYLLARGFDEVYHLKGGILRYLEGVPETESRWRGECFVFDERVALGHGLREHKTADGSDE